MHPTVSLNRRRFIGTATLSTLVLAGGFSTAQPAPGRRFKIITFSKPFQELGPEEAADFVAEIGLDGIECPVRSRGHILPEAVEDELPKFVEAFKRRNLEIATITTDIRDPNSPAGLKVLRTASRLGIKHYRLPYWQYDPNRPIPEQVDRIRRQFQEFAAINKELGITGGYQNHSGTGYVGAPVWDIYELLKDLDPRHMGTHFDIGHATVEGGYSWPTLARLLEPFLSCVYCKDFTWQRTDRGWRAQWRPLGEGMVNRTFFAWLKETDFDGPISQHHEYRLGSRAEMLAAMKQDLRVLREWLA